MPIWLGSERIQDIRLGSSGIAAVYLGADRVWSKASIYQTFDGPNTSDLTGLGFVHYGPGTTYKAAVQNGMCRIALPDSFAELGEFVDRVRYDTAVAPADDGYLEFKFGSLGDDPSPSVPNYRTDIFARGSNGGVTHGVGVRAEYGSIDLISRIAGTEVVRADCGSFDPAADRFRLKFTGNLWTLYRNGELAGEWNDVGGVAASGAGYRSLICRVTGGVELFGPRQFSPWIDYVEYG